MLTNQEYYFDLLKNYLDNLNWENPHEFDCQRLMKLAYEVAINNDVISISEMIDYQFNEIAKSHTKFIPSINKEFEHYYNAFKWLFNN